MFSLMLFMLFFFIGFVAMLYYLLRRLDMQAHLLSDEHAQIRVLLRAMESRLDKITQMDRIEQLFQENSEQRPDKAGIGLMTDNQESGHDPLLHLSFEGPQDVDSQLGRDPALELNLEIEDKTKAQAQ